MKVLFFLVFFGLLNSCASYKDVKVVHNKAKNCEVIDKVTGVNENGSEQAAIRDLRQKALELGGNAVFVEDIIPNGKKYEAIGLVYDCEE